MPVVKITVTQEDIDLGIHMDNQRCPVARAVSRTIGHSVDIGKILRIKDFRGPFSPIVNWIGDYETGVKVGPITFELDFS